MEDCIFCKIVKGEIPSFKIYEDDFTFSFLDIKPMTKGHALVIPKKHSENIFDIDEDSLQKVILTGKHVSGMLKKSLSPDGIRLSQSNGKVAGQDIMHFHLHVIPRYENDVIALSPTFTAHMPQVDLSELEETKNKILN